MNTTELKSLIKEVVVQLINEELNEEKKEKWIQKAVDPKHKGYCTPMTKPTCTPHRKALAKRFKKGDLEEGEYDPQSDTMAYEPRDRIPGDEGPDKLTQAVQKLNQVASRLKVLVDVCRKNNLPNLAKQTEDMMYDIMKFTNSK